MRRWWLIVNRRTGRFSRIAHEEKHARTSDPLFEVVEVAPAVGVLAPDIAEIAATLVDLAKHSLPPHISESQQVEAYLALRSIAAGAVE